MFTPLILACTTSGCIAIGGPAVATEEECTKSIMGAGALFVAQRYPDHKLVDYQCVVWGAST